MKKAIVTLTVGKYYNKRWKNLCENNWQNYAKKHNYKVINISEPLDLSGTAKRRSVAWQKCLILSHQEVSTFDQVVWVDSDILINENAPCIIDKVPIQKVGAVNGHAQFIDPFDINKEKFMPLAIQTLKWNFSTAREYYTYAGLKNTFNEIVQTGVLVLSPHFHREILEEVYYTCKDTPVGDFEMENLSHKLLNNDQVYWLDEKFNRIWTAEMCRSYPFLLPSTKVDNIFVRQWKRHMRGHYQMPALEITRKCLKAAFNTNFFLHFAGSTHYMFPLKHL